MLILWNKMSTWLGRPNRDHVPQAVEGCEQLLMETRYPASLFSASCPALDSSK